MQSVLLRRKVIVSSFAFTNCALFALSWTESALGWSPSLFSSSTAGTGFLRIASVFVSTAATTSSRLFSSATTSSDQHQCPSTTTASSPMLTVVQIPCLSDNYGYLLHDEVTGQTVAIDTPDAAAYQNELQRRNWNLTHIWNTHHHWDHTGGNAELKKLYKGVQVIGPAKEKAKIPGIDVTVQGGDTVQLGSLEAHVLDVGGHTNGHVAYYFPGPGQAFVGDSLFALGCGRMFEGTPEMFWESLQRLRALPDETVVYCAHEYTLSNGKFAMSVEPNNAALVTRFASIQDARARGAPTVPSTMGEEKHTNPFLRVDVSDEIRANVGVVARDSDAIAFGKVRRAKDNFRG